jgi:hypothetical protein
MEAKVPFFLKPQFIAESCRFLELPTEVTAYACHTARRFQRYEALAVAAVNAHRRLYLEKRPVPPNAIIDNLEKEAGLFYLLILLSGLPQMRELHERHAIPASVVRDTLAQVRLYLGDYHQKHGFYGLDDDALNWLAYHIRGELYRLGRLQFMFGTFAHKHVVYRHRTKAQVLVLTEGDHVYRRDGQLNGAGGVVEVNGLWTSQLDETSRGICGHPIDPATGNAMRQTVQLDKAEWKRVLASSDRYLDIHIPEGEPLTLEACRKSFRQALDFFPAHFPTKPFKAFVCISWLCDAQLERQLPPTSNIVRWLEQFYLFPVESDAWSALRSVFGVHVPYNHQGTLDLDALPRETSLQRIILSHLESGGHWRKAGALLFPEDIHRWGLQPYRNSFNEMEIDR